MDITLSLYFPKSNNLQIANVKLFSGALTQNARNYIFLHITGIPEKYLSLAEDKEKITTLLTAGLPLENERKRKAQIYIDKSLLPTGAQTDLFDSSKFKQATVTVAEALAAIKIIEIDTLDPENESLWTERLITTGDW